jgi:hypothetical protein
LVGVDALPARPVQVAQQQVDPVPQPVEVAIALVQRGQQFQNHALERGHVVGQLLGGGWRQASSGIREAHAYNDALRTGFVPRQAKKGEPHLLPAYLPTKPAPPAQHVAGAGRW